MLTDGLIDKLPRGLCANREDHAPHLITNGSLAPFWCHADQARREPYYSERLRRERERVNHEQA